MVAATLTSAGVFTTNAFDEVSKSGFKIVKETNTATVEAIELNEVDFVSRFTIKDKGVLLAKEFVEA